MNRRSLYKDFKELYYKQLNELLIKIEEAGQIKDCGGTRFKLVKELEKLVIEYNNIKETIEENIEEDEE